MKSARLVAAVVAYVDQGPDHARASMGQLLSTYPNDELVFVERSYPASCVCGALDVMLRGGVFVRQASLWLKHFLEKRQAFDLDVKKDAMQLVFARMDHNDDFARVAACMCDCEDDANTKLELINLISTRVEILASPETFHAVEFLNLKTLLMHRQQFCRSMARGVFTHAKISPHCILSFCNVVLTVMLRKHKHQEIWDQSTNDAVLAACAFGAKSCIVAEVRARALECFPKLYNSGIAGDVELLLRTSMDCMSCSDNVSTTLSPNVLVVNQALAFWIAICNDDKALSYLNTLCNSILLPMLWKWEDMPLAIEHSTCTLLGILAARDVTCAETMFAAFESIASDANGLACSNLQWTTRRFALILLGSLCSASSSFVPDSLFIPHSRFLCALVGDDSVPRVRSAACWTLERACTLRADGFFGNPNDFGRLMNALIKIYSCRNADRTEEVLNFASKSLMALIKHDNEQIGGRFSEPYQYTGELGHVPSMEPTTNRFSAYFSQLLESLSADDSPCTCRAMAMLIGSCADDVLGFVCCSLNRQVKLLNDRFAKYNHTNSLLEFEHVSNQRKRGWAAAAAATETASANEDFAQSAMAVVVPQKPFSSASIEDERQVLHVSTMCFRIQASIDRIARSESDDPAVWTLAGDIAHALMNFWTVARESRSHLCRALREVLIIRKDLQVTAIIKEEIATCEDRERLAAICSLCFTACKDSEIVTFLIERVRLQEADYYSNVRISALRALGEVMGQRRHMIGTSENDANAFCESLESAVNLNWNRIFDSNGTRMGDVDEDRTESLDLLWNALDAGLDGFDAFLKAYELTEFSTAKFSGDPIVIHACIEFLTRRCATACRNPRFHPFKIKIALKSLALICRVGVLLTKSSFESLVEHRYEELGPLFDCVAEAVSGKEARGEAAEMGGKCASEALIRVYPKPTF